MTEVIGMMTYSEFLEHAGVKGMKWGVRKDKSSKKQKTKIPLTKREKILVGAAAVTAALAVVGGIALYKSKVDVKKLKISRAKSFMMLDEYQKFVEKLPETMQNWPGSSQGPGFTSQTNLSSKVQTFLKGPDAEIWRNTPLASLKEYKF